MSAVSEFYKESKQIIVKKTLMTTSHQNTKIDQNYNKATQSKTSTVLFTTRNNVEKKNGKITLP